MSGGGLVVLMSCGERGGGGGGGGGSSFTEQTQQRNGANNNMNGSISNNIVNGSGGIGVEPIQAIIWHCLNNYAYADACFLAERVHAEAPSEDTLHCLCTSYYRSGAKSKTYVLLSNCVLKTPSFMTPKNRYLLALVCYELEKYAESESTLLHSMKRDGSMCEQIERMYGEIGAFAVKLYALICVQTERLQTSFDAFGRTLKLNPFLWNAYEYVCRLSTGANVKSNKENEKHHKSGRVFQLPNNENICPENKNFLHVLVGNTAASLILSQGAQKHEETQHCFQNNQNYYEKHSSVFLNSTATGVLHPSNKNNIGKPSKRNLFTSTPMGGNDNPGRTANNFGIIPLHLMDSSSTSTVSNSTNMNLTNVSPPVYGTPLTSSMHSPVVADFTDELQPVPQSFSNAPERPVEPPRAKKPCLRTPWQQQVTTSNITPSSTGSIVPHGTVTISTSNSTLRRSSRLFTNHHHHHLKENNKMNPPMIPLLQTPPSSNANPGGGTPETNSSSGGSRRSSKGKNPASVLKPKLRLNNSTRNNNGEDRVRGSSTSSTSTITSEFKPEVDSPVGKQEPKDGSSMLDSSGEFFRCVMEKSEESGGVTDNRVGSNEHVNKDISVRADRGTANIEAFRNGVDPLLHILSNLSVPYTQQNAYNCVSAISQYQRLKPSQYETGWVHGNIARCYFELGNYEECVKSYRRMSELEPWRTEGLEWLSTAYWHLQKETELSALAQDLMKSNRTNEVATWVAAGNCFSLHKEHETAIKFFKRAIQVNRYCAYAHTLLGHEYVVTEELEKALRCFRSATRIDCSHYNAWYGIGMIFYKQERFDRAELYYRKALGIHPNNSVLLCHLGVVQHALGRPEKSLVTFSHALEANKHDPLCKFHRASVLFGVGKLDEALEELEELKEIVPKESLVYFLIAKIFSKKGDTHKALLHFSWATDLDPKGANNQIKESIEPVLTRVTNTSNALLTTVNSTTVEESNIEQEEEEEEDEEEDDEEEEEEDDDDDEEEEDNESRASGNAPSSQQPTQQQQLPVVQISDERTRNTRGRSTE